MTTIFSVDPSDYLVWQSRLLARSFHQVGQPGKLVRIMSGRTNSSGLEGSTTFYTDSFRHVAGSDYPPMNKPFGISEWLRSGEESDDMIHIIDPDCVYVRRLEPVISGMPVAEEINFMGMSDPIHRMIINKYCREDARNKVQGVGVPIIIHRDSLSGFSGRWAELTVEMRMDNTAVAAVGWTCEMWAFVIAAAEAGVRFDVHKNQQVCIEPFYNRPIIHYSYDIGPYWSKRTYRPWDGIPVPPEISGTGRVFLDHLNAAVGEMR